MTWRFPGRQWFSRLSAMGGAHLAPPVDLDVATIPSQGDPAQWSYSSSSLALNVGVPMTPLVPTITSGAPYRWEVRNTGDYPVNLPGGLSIDPLSGTISGTPTTVGGPTTFRIVSASRGGSHAFALTITVAP